MAFGENSAVSGNRYNTDNILNASFGEIENGIRVSFKKTVLIRQYETETVEYETELKLDHEVDGMDRAFINILLQSQLEIQCMQHLYLQGRIPEDEYRRRIANIEYCTNTLASKYEQVTGKSADNYLKLTGSR